MAWEDDKSWEEVDKIIQDGEDEKAKEDRHEKPVIEIPIYNSDPDKLSIWQLFKKYILRKEN
jgi:hypothetical protein